MGFSCSFTPRRCRRRMCEWEDVQTLTPLAAGAARTSNQRHRVALPVGVEPTSPAWKAGTSAARPRAHRRRERESNPQGLRSTVFKTAAVANRLVPPREAAAAGVEPAIISLTGSCLTVRPHRNESVRAAGFEPALSCARGRRNSRLSHALMSPIKAPSGSRTRTSAMARQQATATSWAQRIGPNCQRSQSTGWDFPERACAVNGRHTGLWT